MSGFFKKLFGFKRADEQPAGEVPVAVEAEAVAAVEPEPEIAVTPEAVDVVLLISVSIHGYLGFRGILLDYINSSRLACFITYTIFFAIAATILYGLVALRAFI